MKRSLLVVVLVGVVSITGCLGGPSLVGSPGDESISADTVPGISNGTLTQPTALADANRAILATRGAEIRLNRVTESTNANYTQTVGSNLSTYALSGRYIPPDGAGFDVELWSNETTQFVRMDRDSGVRYNVAPTEGEPLRRLGTLDALLSGAQFTTPDNATEDGTVVLTADEYAAPSDGHDQFSQATSFDARLVVEQSGEIQELTVDAVSDGQSITYRYELLATGVERVPRPGWIDDVPASASLRPQLEVRVVNDSAIRIENQGRDPVPPESTVRIETNSTTGRTVLEAGLAEGDVRYLYFDDSGAGLRNAPAMPNEDVAAQLKSPVSITISAEDSVTLYSGSFGWDSSSATEGAGGDGAAGGSSGES